MTKKEIFTTVRQRLNQSFTELRPRYHKVKRMYFREIAGSLYFIFSHSNTSFNYFLCKITSKKEDDDLVYNELLNDMLEFMAYGTHIKLIKDPIKAIRKYNLKIGEDVASI